MNSFIAWDRVGRRVGVVKAIDATEAKRIATVSGWAYTRIEPVTDVEFNLLGDNPLIRARLLLEA